MMHSFRLWKCECDSRQWEEWPCMARAYSRRKRTTVPPPPAIALFLDQEGFLLHLRPCSSSAMSPSKTEEMSVGPQIAARERSCQTSRSFRVAHSLTYRGARAHSHPPSLLAPFCSSSWDSEQRYTLSTLFSSRLPRPWHACAASRTCLETFRP
jgi:hypothetical protein